MNNWQTFLLGSRKQGAGRLLRALGWALLVPALLGAKGCELGKIGSNDASCGGKLGDTCAEGEFCKASGNKCGGEGTCAPIPEICTLIDEPVCGCDDKTYGNECDAHGHGVSVAKSGTCEAEPGSDCGGIAGLGCDEGEFCNYPVEASCGATDQTGVCTKLPDACDLIYSPVCGCDDLTYGNECAARIAGISVAKNEACAGGGDVVCGGLQGAACDKGEFCDFGANGQCGAADQTGVCRAVPETCTEEYAPVCGCDDKTYSNECFASGAGVSVSYKGECTGKGVACGTRGLPISECGEDEYCRYPAGANCGETDKPGTCETRPEACDLVYAPVCGCDGKTYSNACDAASKGASVAREGACGTVGDVCGGLQGLACAEGMFCAYEVEANCGRADATGTCALITEICSADYSPVCGCDGNTYSNECAASSQGVSVESVGKCAETGQVCGGIAGVACQKGEYCNFPSETMCGSGDQQGTCEPIPSACTKELNQVCGCDGKVYNNPCMAAQANVSLMPKVSDCEPREPCGGSEKIGCGEGFFCDDPSCGAGTDGLMFGLCQPVPDGCTLQVDRVCGCDETTYSNQCEANTKGVAAQWKGTCEDGPTVPPEPEKCGGIQGLTCKGEQFCQFQQVDQCGNGDQMGTCADKPAEETCKSWGDNPTCGCDGKTYGNICYASAVGVSTRSTGACTN